MENDVRLAKHGKMIPALPTPCPAVHSISTIAYTNRRAFLIRLV